MVYTPHAPVKAEKLVNQYIGLVERRTVVSQIFNRQGIEDFKGSEGDATTIKVPGRLPARRYAFRNDRSAPIKLDVYKERKITTTFGDLLYSGSPIADEQADFDGVSPTSLLQPQSRAVAAELEQICIEKMTDESLYEVLIGGFRGNGKRGLIAARRTFNSLRAPDAGRFMLVGAEFEEELLLDEKLGLGNNGADSQGSDGSAFAGASIGTRYGITFVRSDEIEPEDAYLLTGNAFNLLTGAPGVPEGKDGATTSYNGLSLRWMKDYDFMYRTNRSTVDTYVGTSHTTDVFLQFDKATLEGDTTHVGEVVGTQDHFVRGIKLTLDGSSSGPAANSAFALDTGISGATLWSGNAPTP